jgi:hypothetical protein
MLLAPLPVSYLLSAPRKHKVPENKNGNKKDIGRGTTRTYIAHTTPCFGSYLCTPITGVQCIWNRSAVDVECGRLTIGPRALCILIVTSGIE